MDKLSQGWQVAKGDELELGCRIWFWEVPKA